jgi:hypothetical protein
MNTKTLIFAFGLLAVAASGCGSNVSGSYSGTEVVSINGITTPTTVATVSLIQSSNDRVSGTITSQYGSGVITARPIPGQLNAVVLTMTQSFLFDQNGVVAPVNIASSIINLNRTVCGPYIGNLAQTNAGGLSGTLTTQTAATNPTGTTPVISSYFCPTTHTFNLAR